MLTKKDIIFASIVTILLFFVNLLFTKETIENPTRRDIQGSSVGILNTW